MDNARMYVQFALGLRRFLKHPPKSETARAAVNKNLANRESNFLRLLEHGVYANPRSPYLALLNHAGITLSDVKSMIDQCGLERTLRMLHEKGVYVTFEEFKGRVPIERPGFRLEHSDRDFDNPKLRSYYEGQTSGSTGAGTRVAMDLDHMSETLNQCMVYLDLMDDLEAPAAIWFPVLPATSGLSSCLIVACLGMRVDKWFTPVTSAKMHIPARYRIATEYARGMARMFGVKIPRPEPVSVSEAGRIALWAHKTIREHGRCILITYVSLGVRVALAAREMGLDLTGALFAGAGEPPTPAKVRTIRSSGATFLSSYGFTEGGMVALSCSRPASENDLHVWRDAWAIIQNPVHVPKSTLVVDAFCFTALFASAPKIMLNVELDDYGILDQRDCGCPMQLAGFPDHVRDIFSFRKLTGEGMTLVGSTMLKVIEETLPAEFGGSALDYQLIEEEDENGFTRLTVVISPTVGPIDDAAVIERVLAEVAKDSPGADLAHAIWRDAGTLRVRREDPTWSTLGKLLSLRPANRNAGIVFDESGERVGV
jgi:hypothetical protein